MYYSEKAEHFNWGEVKRGIFSLGTWLTACAYFGILAGLYSFGLFVSIPTNLPEPDFSVNRIPVVTNYHYGVRIYRE
jgi:hypothetical protein